MIVIDKDFQEHWRVVQPLFSIRNEDEYDKAVSTLNELIDEARTNENTHFMNFLLAAGFQVIVKSKNICTLPGRCGFLTASSAKVRLGNRTYRSV